MNIRFDLAIHDKDRSRLRLISDDDKSSDNSSDLVGSGPKQIPIRMVKGRVEEGVGKGIGSRLKSSKVSSFKFKDGNSEQVGASDPQDKAVPDILVLLRVLMKQCGGASGLSAPTYARTSRTELLSPAPQIVSMAPGWMSCPWRSWTCPGNRISRVHSWKLRRLKM